MKWEVLDALHSLRTEGSRLDVVRRLCEGRFAALSLGPQFGRAVGAIRFCQKLRNQYAHAEWGSFPKGLCFFKPEEAKWKSDGNIHWRFLDQRLLQEQVDFFVYTRACLLHLETKLEDDFPTLPMPAERKRPRLFLQDSKA